MGSKQEMESQGQIVFGQVVGEPKVKDFEILKGELLCMGRWPNKYAVWASDAKGSLILRGGLATAA